MAISCHYHPHLHQHFASSQNIQLPVRVMHICGSRKLPNWVDFGIGGINKRSIYVAFYRSLAHAILFPNLAYIVIFFTWPAYIVIFYTWPAFIVILYLYDWHILSYCIQSMAGIYCDIFSIRLAYVRCTFSSCWCIWVGQRSEVLQRIMALLAENPKMFARKRHLSPVLFQLCRQTGDLPPFTWFLTPLVTFEMATLDAARFFYFR